MDWEVFISKIKPDGKPFRNISFSKDFFDTLAYGFNLIKEYAVYTLSDQVWYLNSNFDPEPWEERYIIEVPATATLQERREVVKAYMLYPQSLNRLSKDFIKNTLIDAGFTDIDIEYNPTGLTEGFLRANTFGDEKLSFSLGSLTYNSFIISGEVTATYYANAIMQALTLKPLQVAMYDQLDVLAAIALDDDYAIALPVILENEFGSSGSGDSQFNSMRYNFIANDLLYVVDSGNHRVQIFDLDGTFDSKFGSYGTGNGEFNTPTGVFATDTYIYVTDGGNDRVQVFNLSGVYQSQFGSSGSGNGEMNSPYGIYLNDTNIFIADRNNNRVQIFDLSGTYVSKFGSYGTGNGEFSLPTDLKIIDNKIYVLDTGNDRVQIFDISGNYITEFGTSGTGDGEFQAPYGITFNDDYIYVSDSTRNDVQIFDYSYDFVSKYDLDFNFIFGITGYGESIYICDRSNNKIKVSSKVEYAIALTVL